MINTGTNIAFLATIPHFCVVSDKFFVCDLLAADLIDEHFCHSNRATPKNRKQNKRSRKQTILRDQGQHGELLSVSLTDQTVVRL